MKKSTVRFAFINKFKGNVDICFILSGERSRLSRIALSHRLAMEFSDGRMLFEAR